jgi:hypothetical protein
MARFLGRVTSKRQLARVVARREAAVFAVPAATLLRLALSKNWAFIDARASDTVEAARLACECYRLGSAILDEAPDDGWPDAHLFDTGAWLVAVGDLHAIHSVDWPDGFPQDLFNEPSRSRAGFEKSGLSAWTQRTARHAPDPRDTATWTSLYGRVAIHDAPAPDTELDDDELEKYRGRENPRWPEYEQTRRATAEFYRAAVRTHAGLYADLDDVADAEWIFLDLHELRIDVAREIAHGHRSTTWLIEHGAQAEAIFATLTALELLREVYLMVSTRSLAEFRDLATRTPEMNAQCVFTRFLDEWAERLDPQAHSEA